MILLDIAGYGLFESAGGVLAFLGKVLVGGFLALGAALGLLVFGLLALAGIAVFSVRRGMRYRSVPRTLGTFFRLSGLLAGAVVALVLLPVALLLNAKLWVVLLITAGAVVMGYIAGRTISRIIGFKLSRYGYYVRTFNNLRGKIVRLVYSY